MKVFKKIPIIYSIFFMLAIITLSCQNKLTEYPTLATLPCKSTNVVKDPNILTDFECQSNIVLPNVEAVRNPSEIQVNKSKYVGKIIDGIEALDALVIDYGTSPIDLSTRAVFKIKVKTLVNGILNVKLKGANSTPIEMETNIIGDNGWAEYAFNFSVYPKGNYTKVLLFFNAGVKTKGTDIYYIDDLFFDLSINPCKKIEKDLSIINNFDCQKNQPMPGVEKVLTPNKSDTNNSIFCGKYIDKTDAQDAIVIDLKSPIDLSIKNVFKIKVNAPVTGTLKVKLEGGTSNQVEKDAQITKTKKWVEYSFDFSNQASKNHTKLAIIFNAGVNTKGKDIYYIDDLNFTELDNPCANATPDVSIVNNAECQQNYKVEGNAPTTIIDNPDKSGINKSKKVLEIKDNGKEAWDHLLLNFSKKIDLSTKNILKFKVRSSKKVPLKAKLEGGSSDPIEIDTNISTIDSWIEYTFDFSSQASKNHTKIVLFFNANKTDGTKADIYYVDDIKWE